MRRVARALKAKLGLSERMAIESTLQPRLIPHLRLLEVVIIEDTVGENDTNATDGGPHDAPTNE